jgi:hypothetical protein
VFVMVATLASAASACVSRTHLMLCSDQSCVFFTVAVWSEWLCSACSSLQSLCCFDQPIFVYTHRVCAWLTVCINQRSMLTAFAWCIRGLFSLSMPRCNASALLPCWHLWQCNSPAQLGVGLDVILVLNPGHT